MIVIKNIQKGLYGTPRRLAVIPEDSLLSLQAHAENLLKTATQDKWAIILSALNALPVVVQDFQGASRRYRCVVHVSSWDAHINPNTDRASMGLTDQVELWGWEASSRLTSRLTDMLFKACSDLKIPCDIRSLRQAQLLHNKHRFGYLEIQDIDPIAALSSATSYAIYNSRWDSYLSAQEQPTVLSTAQLFATIFTAQSAANKAGWAPEETVIVEVASQVTRLAPGVPQPTTSNQGLLAAALAQINRDEIAGKVVVPEIKGPSKKM